MYLGYSFSFSCYFKNVFKTTKKIRVIYEFEKKYLVDSLKYYTYTGFKQVYISE